MLDENVNRALYTLCFVSLLVRTGQIAHWKGSVNEQERSKSFANWFAASELYEERPSEHNLTFFSMQSLHKYLVHFNDFIW